MASGANIFSEYLVKLGFSTDQISFQQFQHTLRDATSIVNNEYLSMAKAVFDFQGAVTGAFAAIGLGALKIADDTANADQNYRLLALHMYTSLPVARELKIALDALGQPLENIVWDPELAARFNTLVKDQRILTEELGPGFENQMKKIRDVRFEWTRFGVELQYLTMHVVEDLAESFGTTADGILEKARGLNDYLIQHMPEISNFIATRLTPILLDTKDVAFATFDVLKQGAADFTTLVGVLSNNKSLEGTQFSFNKLATSIQIVVHALRLFIDQITKVENDVNRSFQSLTHFKAAADALYHGDFKGAYNELKQGAQQEARSDFGHLADAAPTVSLSPQSASIQQIIVQTAQRLGVDPKLALAVAQQESAFRQVDSSGNTLRSSTGALGVMQLLPSTARSLGVDPNNVNQNILGGELYIRKLLQQFHGNTELALEHYYGSKDAVANSTYAQQVLQKEQSINISGVNITIEAKTDATPKQIGDAVMDALHTIVKNQSSQTQRNITEYSQPGTSY